MATIIETYAPSLSADVFDAYDAFLALLGDEQKRKLLEKLAPDDAYKNDIFLEARDVATKFDEALITLLFDSDDRLSRLARKYGVF